jgi:hypothetical protein
MLDAKLPLPGAPEAEVKRDASPAATSNLAAGEC